MSIDTIRQKDDALLAKIFPGNSELAERMRQFPWHETPMGRVEDWPQNLRLALSICLLSKFPMHIWWGPESTLFYNDSYISFLGHKHPHALGQSGKVVWKEVMDDIAPIIAKVSKGGVSNWAQDVLMNIDRSVDKEEVYVTFSFSPVLGGDGKVDGLFCACTETTEIILGNRRVDSLRRLGLGLNDVQSIPEACLKAIEALSTNPYDIPFAAIYIFNETTQHALLQSHSTLAKNQSFPAIVSKDDGTLLSCVFDLLTKKEECGVVDLRKIDNVLPRGPWPEDVTQGTLVIIPGSTLESPAGFLFCGTSPRLLLSENYRTFYNLVANQIGKAILNVRAYEIEHERAEKLAKLDKAKTIFFSNISHEFRTPLTLILSPLEDAIDDLLRNKTAILPSLKMVRHNALRLQKLVNTLLDFSRVEANRAQPNFQLIDIGKVTVDIASLFRSTIEKAGLSYEIVTDAFTQKVAVDYEMWEKIVLNLISNAFKYTFTGKIEVSLRKSGQFAELQVCDTGRGISTDSLTHIFERFYRVEGEIARSHEGSGIGLALVKELIQIHGGKITVDSKLGAGSTFIVQLPFASDTSPLPNAATNIASSANAQIFVDEASRWTTETNFLHDDESELTVEDDIQGRNVLIVDDNADMLEYLIRLLKKMNLFVVAARNGEEALSHLKKHTFDLVVTDVMMPVIDGFTLVKMLRADPQLKMIPVIILSARAGEEAQVEGLDQGADDYLVKPFSAKQLMARVKAQLKLSQRHQLEAENMALRIAKNDADKINRAKDLFLATLSHELRTPLTAMLCWTQNLKNELVTDKAKEALQAIEENAHLQKHLVNDLLEVSSIILNKLNVELKPINPRDILHKSIESFRAIANEKSIAIHYHADDATTHVQADPLRLQQIFNNLLSNAVKFTHQDGMINVHIKEVNKQLEIAIKDNGIGISPDFLPYVFDRFSQAITTSNYSGLGLGLTIVYNLLKLQNASIVARSEGLNQGATFTVLFPIHTPA